MMEMVSGGIPVDSRERGAGRKKKDGVKRQIGEGLSGRQGKGDEGPGMLLVQSKPGREVTIYNKERLLAERDQAGGIPVAVRASVVRATEAADHWALGRAGCKAVRVLFFALSDQGGESRREPPKEIRFSAAREISSCDYVLYVIAKRGRAARARDVPVLEFGICPGRKVELAAAFRSLLAPGMQVHADALSFPGRRLDNYLVKTVNVDGYDADHAGPRAMLVSD